METESAVINRYGYLFSIVLMNKGALFAEKADALINRCRGRDIYDVVFMLQRKFPIDESVLKAKGWQKESQQIILEHIENIKPQELIRLSKQVEPRTIPFENKSSTILINVITASKPRLY